MEDFQGISCLERNRQWGTAWVSADSKDTRRTRVLHIVLSWLLTSPLSLYVGHAHSAKIWNNLFWGKKCLDLHEKFQRQHSVCSLSSFWCHPWKPPCFWDSELAKDGLPSDLALSHLTSLTVWLMQTVSLGILVRYIYPSLLVCWWFLLEALGESSRCEVPALFMS